jgi:hypothetical protein
MFTFNPLPAPLSQFGFGIRMAKDQADENSSATKKTMANI